MSQHWSPQNHPTAYTSRPTRSVPRQRGSKGLSMGATWAFLFVALVLFMAAFAYLLLLANRPAVCEPHAWLDDITVCHTEPTEPARP